MPSPVCLMIWLFVIKDDINMLLFISMLAGSGPHSNSAVCSLLWSLFICSAPTLALLKKPKLFLNSAALRKIYVYCFFFFFLIEFIGVTLQVSSIQLNETSSVHSILWAILLMLLHLYLWDWARFCYFSLYYLNSQ